jgi:hypothetical protein
MTGYDEGSGADRHHQIKRAYMERLSGLDAFFLYVETPTQPLNVCCVMELDTSTMPGGYTFDRFRDAMMLRVDAVPEFRLKLANSQLNLDHPVWFDDDDVQLDRHLHRVGCRRREDDTSSTTSVAISRRCRWIATIRCGRCG